MAILRPLTPAEVQAAQAQYNTVGQSATHAITSNKFVFFAAFDGTNNNRNNPAYAGDTQSTAVGSLSRQVDSANANNSNVVSRYYPGPGTPEAGGKIGAAFPMQQMQANAEKAYNDFVREAQAWLDADPTRTPADITTAITGFSRGAPTGVIFSQLLEERGLPLANGTVLIVPVDALLLIEPVSTGYTGNLSIRGNVNPDNITVVRAVNEDRFHFEADDYSGDLRVNTVFVTSNHGDAGAFYDRGLGGMALESYTQFFNATGLPTAPVPADRTYDPSQPVVLHSEGINANGTQRWGEWNTPDVRETKSIAAPQNVLTNDPRVQSTSSTYNEQDGTTLRTITYKNGTVVKQLVDGDGNIVLNASGSDQINLDSATGKYSVTNSTTQETSTYDPDTQVSSYSKPGSATVSVDAAGDVVRVTGSGSNYAVESADGENYTTFSATKNPTTQEIELTGITSVNGQSPNASMSGITNASLAGAHITTDDLLENPGNVTPYVEAVDPTNPSGTTASPIPSSAINPSTGAIDWSFLDKFGSYGGDAVSLIMAVRSGKPIAIASAGFNVASHHITDPTVAGVAAAFSGITSLSGLKQALEKGDLGRILIDGGGVARSAITVYQNVVQYQLIEQFGSVAGARLAIDQGNTDALELIGQFDGATALLKDLGNAIAVLNIINSLAHGDIKGAFISAVAYFYPVAGAVLQVIDFLNSEFFSGNHTFEAKGHYAIQADGSLVEDIASRMPWGSNYKPNAANDSHWLQQA